jgi:hypothetical protein
MKITYDPTINLGHVISILSFAFLGVGAYYDIKSDVRNLTTISEQRWDTQKIVDANQDQRLGEIRVTVQSSTDTINKKIDFLVSRDPRK